MNTCTRKAVLGILGPGQLDPGQLGPGQSGPGAQLSTFSRRTVGPRTVGPLDSWAPDNWAPGKYINLADICSRNVPIRDIYSPNIGNIYPMQIYGIFLVYTLGTLPPPSKSDKTLYTGIYLPTFREGTNFIIKLLVSCLGALTGPGGGPP